MSFFYIKEIYSNNRLTAIKVDGILDFKTLLFLKKNYLKHVKKIELDLRGIVYISREVKEILNQMEQEGVHIKYSPYVGLKEKGT